jgi:hypothetical protein
VEEETVDGNRFDGLIKRFSSDGLGRRDAAKAVVGGALGIAIGRAAIDVASAKKRCKKDFSTCPTDPAKCCTKECCPPFNGEGDDFCRPKNGVCCSAADGGSFCPSDFPTCCGIGPRQRFGLCTPPGANCCTIESGGGWCAAGEECCDDAGTPSCCTLVTTSKGRSAAVRPRRRNGATRR